VAGSKAPSYEMNVAGPSGKVSTFTWRGPFDLASLLAILWKEYDAIADCAHTLTYESNDDVNNDFEVRRQQCVMPY
jgi:hypothetical protein